MYQYTIYIRGGGATKISHRAPNSLEPGLQSRPEYNKWRFPNNRIKHMFLKGRKINPDDEPAEVV
jgi:hypothetical protein